MTSTASRPIINTDLVLLDVDAGADKQAVIGRLVGRLADAGRTTDADGLIAAAMAREEQSATGLPGGIAIPHCRSPYVDTASIGFARLNPAVDFGAPDGPADLAFLIAAPGGRRRRAHEAAVQPGPGAGAQGLRRSRCATRRSPTRSSRSSTACSTRRPKPKPARPQPRRRPQRRTPKTLVAITACPTGIAHTYMAADSLVAAAKEAGVDAARRDAGLVGQHAARRRRRSPAPTPSSSPPTSASRTAALRGQARHRLRRQARDQRARQDGRRSARRRGQSRTPPASRAARRAAAAERRAGGRRRLGHPHPADPAHRRQLHDPVRRRRRSADRARLPVRRLRDRQQARGRDAVARQHHRHHQLADQPARRRLHRSTSARCCSASAGWRSGSWSRTGRLHLVRDRRPARHRTGLHRGRGRRLRRRRLHRRHRRRPDRRLHRTVDQPHQRAAVAPRPDAGGDHPAVRVAGRRPADVPAARPPAGRDHLRPDQLAQRHDGQLGRSSSASSSA